MNELMGKTAVITGGASGIGLAMAKRFAAAGMNIVAADVEEPVLDDAISQIQAAGDGGAGSPTAVGVICDVTDADAVDALAARAVDEFGAAHLIANNAGVSGSMGGGADGRLDLAEWKWVLDVNLYGVIHGHRSFLPLFIEQGEGHVVNTASMAGHLPGHSAYSASKWAVVGITEGLFQQMSRERTGVGVSCLCPGFVSTRIHESARNRPEWAAPQALAEPNANDEARRAFVAALVEGGRNPAEVADLVHDAVVGDRFWIFTDDRMVQMQAPRYESILAGENPPAIAVG